MRTQANRAGNKNANECKKLCSHCVRCVTASSPAFRVLSPLPISMLLITLVSPQKNVQVQAPAQVYSLLGVLLYINPKLVA